MTLYSKNGSYPQSTVDGTDGWIEVDEMPICPDGHEVVWLNFAWTVRPTVPSLEGDWKWNHDMQMWFDADAVAPHSDDAVEDDAVDDGTTVSNN